MEKPHALGWYPGGLAWQMNFSRAQARAGSPRAAAREEVVGRRRALPRARRGAVAHCTLHRRLPPTRPPNFTLHAAAQAAGAGRAARVHQARERDGGHHAPGAGLQAAQGTAERRVRPPACTRSLSLAPRASRAPSPPPRARPARRRRCPWCRRCSWTWRRTTACSTCAPPPAPRPSSCWRCCTRVRGRQPRGGLCHCRSCRLADIGAQQWREARGPRLPAVPHPPARRLPMPAGPAPATGLVVANDADVMRCSLLTHQTNRMCSPAILVTNHEAQARAGGAQAGPGVRAGVQDPGRTASCLGRRPWGRPRQRWAGAHLRLTAALLPALVSAPPPARPSRCCATWTPPAPTPTSSSTASSATCPARVGGRAEPWLGAARQRVARCFGGCWMRGCWGLACRCAACTAALHCAACCTRPTTHGR